MQTTNQQSALSAAVQSSEHESKPGQFETVRSVGKGKTELPFLVTISRWIKREAIALPSLAMQIPEFDARPRPNGREHSRGQLRSDKAVVRSQYRNALGNGETVDSIIAEGFDDGLIRAGPKPCVRSKTLRNDCHAPTVRGSRNALTMKSPARKSESVDAISLPAAK